VREVEFLPNWYPQLRRRRRVVALMAWVTVGLLAGMGSWVAVTQQKIHTRQTRLVQLDGELQRSREELKDLDNLVTFEKKLKERAQVLNKVGFHVEAARLLATLDEVMPKSASLLEVSFLTEEKQPVTLVAAKAAQERDRVADRRLNVRVSGIAPTDVEVADFLTKLTGKPFFEDVRMTGSKPRMEAGHMMREFEVYFSMNLNDVTGA
jgi:Tfp pilus assembly protein PilN